MPRLVVAMVSLLALSACQTTEQTRDRVSAFFTEVAFGDNSALVTEADLKKRGITRWSEAPRIVVRGKPSAAQLAALQTSVSRFAAASGLDLTLVDSEPDITIRFTQDREFVIRNNVPAACYAHTRRRGSRISSVEIKIGRRDDPDSVWCLDHELMHAFGFFGHSHRLSSVMSGSHHQETLTEWDILALEIMYSTEVSEGDRWADIRSVALKHINRKIE